MRRALLPALLVAGCSGKVPPHLSAIEAQIFSPNCTSASCHSTAGAAGNMTLTPGKSFANLVGRTPDNAAAAGEGLKRVAPGDTAHSFLLLKLHDPLDRKYGDRMPQSQAALDAGEIGSIEEWIRLGAQND